MLSPMSQRRCAPLLRTAFLILIVLPGGAKAVLIGASSEANRTGTLGPPTFTTTYGISSGLQTQLFVGTESRTFPTNPVITNDAAIDFSLASLLAVPQGVQITAATLSLSLSLSSNASTAIGLSVSGYGDPNGTVDLADFNLGSTAIGSTASFTSPYPQFVTYSGATLVSFLQGLSNSQVGFAGFRLSQLGSTTSALLQFSGSDPSVASSLRPSLNITFTPNAVPEPASLVLTGLGLPILVTLGLRFRGGRKSRGVAAR